MENEKICSSCNKEKPLADFSKSARSKDGLCPLCKECAKLKVSEWIKKNPSKRAKNQSNYYLRHASKIGMNKKTRLYGLSEKDYIKLLSQQRNLCVLCKTSFKKTKPVIDHCHETGLVRGILCNGCNVNLERLRNKDNNWIKRAQKYLKTIETSEAR